MGFDTGNNLREGSPTRVLARNIIFIFRLVYLEHKNLFTKSVYYVGHGSTVGLTTVDCMSGGEGRGRGAVRIATPRRMVRRTTRRRFACRVFSYILDRYVTNSAASVPWRCRTDVFRRSSRAPTGVVSYYTRRHRGVTDENCCERGA